MYNKYSYDLSNTNMNMNSNIADCFEKVSINDTQNIKDILNNINKKFIENNYEGSEEDIKSDYTYSKSTFSYSKPSYTSSKYTYSKPTTSTFSYSKPSYTSYKYTYSKPTTSTFRTKYI